MIARLIDAAALLLLLAHPFIHNTPLDGGMLDGLFVWLNTRASLTGR